MSNLHEDDEYYDYLKQDYEEGIRERAVSDFIENKPKLESAYEILNYLPIRRDVLENDYITHLWDAFVELDSGLETARSFLVMPFHLLFILAIQYKVLRIYKEQKDEYIIALFTNNPRNEEKDVLTPGSPLTIAFFNESLIIDLLKIAGLGVAEVKFIKKAVIRYRNDKVAHAKGYIERDLDNKIIEYFQCLELVQKAFFVLNNKILEGWLAEIQVDDDIVEFLEVRFMNSCISANDFGDMISNFLLSKKLNIEQWQQVVDKGLEIATQSTIVALRMIAISGAPNNKRFIAIKILLDQDEINEEFKQRLVNCKNTKKIIKLLT